MKTKTQLTADALEVGGWYRAKQYREFLTINNDRQIIWKGITQVQYNSDSVRNGRHFPRVTIEAFLKWADRRLTDAEIAAYNARQ